MNIKHFIIIILIIITIVTIIEGIIYNNFIGFLIRNTIEGILVLIGVFIGTKLNDEKDSDGDV